MIKINYKGRFGNNLFQYCFGRILATELGMYIDKYKGQYYEHFKNINKPFNTNQKTDYKKDIVLTKHRVDFKNILKNKDKKNIKLNGFFQRYSYYKHYKDYIKNWLYLPDIDQNFNDNDILLHVRRSDFLKNDGAVNLNFYSNILDNNDFNNVYITGGTGCKCGYDIDNKVKKHFKKYNPTYIDENPIKTFKIIKKFKNVIQSMSTFCWWACYLSDNAEKIYTPLGKNKGYWNENGNKIDLRVDEKRYIYIKNVSIDHN